jgi:cell fate regulator YaaT (PSP1 superfamily)
MKLVDIEYAFDRTKIIFYFTSDGRVDFRELVKDLARVSNQESSCVR